MNVEQELDVLKRQMQALRRNYNRLDAWLDTVNSPLYKRVWFWMRGYRFYRLGRWYGKDKDETHYY